MIYLGLDQSPRRIGYAFGWPNMMRPTVGVHEIPAVGSHYAVTLAAARDWLADLIREHGVTHLCFESPIFAGLTNANHLRQMMALAGAIELTALDLGVNCREVNAQTWRARFIGRARAPKYIAKTKRREWVKQQAIRACILRGWVVAQGKGEADDAEACGILDYLLSCDFPEYARRKPAFPAAGVDLLSSIDVGGGVA